MKRKITAIAVSGGIAAAVSCSLAIAGNAAPAKQHTHTKHFDAHTVSRLKIDKRNDVSTVDLRSRHVATAGHIKGAAVLTCHQKTPHSKAVHCQAAFALKRGILSGHAKLSYSNFRLTGTINHGSGKYKGAHGTFFAVGESANDSIITLQYKL